MISHTRAVLEDQLTWKLASLKKSDSLSGIRLIEALDDAEIETMSEKAEPMTNLGVALERAGKNDAADAFASAAALDPADVKSAAWATQARLRPAGKK